MAKLLERFADEVWENWRLGRGHCSGCPLRRTGPTSVPVGTLGKLDSNILVVAENPGPTRLNDRDLGKEHWTREFWAGACAGRRGPLFFPFVDNMLAAASLSLRDIHFTNVCRCNYIGRERRAIDTPGVKRCLAYLNEEIRLSRPALIVTFGRPAYKEVAQLIGVRSDVPLLEKTGSPIRSPGGQVLLPFVHPSGRARAQYCHRHPDKDYETHLSKSFAATYGRISR
jgi:uracil-DNA glycosylase family 4